MAINHKVLCKKHARTEKNIEVFKHFMAFLRTSVTALTTCARIMCIWFTLLFKNLSSIKGFSEHYKICLTQDGSPPREIKLGIKTSTNLL